MWGPLNDSERAETWTGALEHGRDTTRLKYLALVELADGKYPPFFSFLFFFSLNASVPCVENVDFGVF